jgi:hypothetical protein
VVRSSQGEFQELRAHAPSLPGLTQRLEELITLQLQTRQQSDVSDFDFIGDTHSNLLTGSDGIVECNLRP